MKQKKEIAKTYVDDLKKQKNAHFTCYTILKNGGLARKDFISEKDKHYLIVSYFDFDHNQLTSRIAYGKIVKDIAYDGFRIDPLKSYECNNLFLTDWNQNSIEQLEFCDLLNYLYALDTDEPYIGSEYPSNKTQYVKKIDAAFFEQLFMKYFTIDQKQLRKSSCYDAVS